MERIVAIIEARMGSSRLPGKSLRPLAGVPLVERVADRARRAKTLDEVVVATSTSPKDDVLADRLRAAGFPVYRGDEHDVLARILGAAHERNATVLVQCWGDCPFLEPGEIDRVVTALVDGDADLVGNRLWDDGQLPYGLDVIALRVGALEVAERATRGHAYHREHGTTYIYQTPGMFKVQRIDVPLDLRYPAFNLAVNEEQDFQFASAIYDAFYPETPEFTIREVMALLRSRPDLLAHPNARTLA